MLIACRLKVLHNNGKKYKRFLVPYDEKAVEDLSCCLATTYSSKSTEITRAQAVLWTSTGQYPQSSTVHEQITARAKVAWQLLHEIEAWLIFHD